MSTFHDQQRLAYHLWESAHRPAGRSLEFWLEAERQIAAEQGNPIPKTSAPNVAKATQLAAKKSLPAVSKSAKPQPTRKTPSSRTTAQKLPSPSVRKTKSGAL